MSRRGVNKVILVGNLGQDPEVRYMPNGGAVANVTLATSESWKDQQGVQQERTEWHRVVFYKRLAEIVGEYLKKGAQIYIEGSLHTRKWQDQQGNDRYSTDIKANELQMLGSGSKDGGQSQGGQQQRQPNQRNHQNQDGSAKSPEQMKAAGQMQEPDFSFDDDIPF